MSKQRSLVFRPVLTIGVLAMLCALWLPALPATAAAPGAQGTTPAMPTRPPTATPEMPPRPLIVTTVVPTDTVTVVPSEPSGAIELRVQFLSDAPADMNWRKNLLTAVEWRDGLGNWHVVDGWQARMDEVKSQHGVKSWYVSEELFGKGPFCWVIYPDANSDPIAVSLPFNMPASSGVIVGTELALGKPVPLPPRQHGSGASAPVTGGEQQDFTVLRVTLTVILILLLVGSLLFRGARRRIE